MSGEKMISYIDRQLRSLQSGIEVAFDAHRRQLEQVITDIGELRDTVEYLSMQKDPKNAPD